MYVITLYFVLPYLCIIIKLQKKKKLRCCVSSGSDGNNISRTLFCSDCCYQILYFPLFFESSELYCDVFFCYLSKWEHILKKIAKSLPNYDYFSEKLIEDEL